MKNNKLLLVGIIVLIFVSFASVVIVLFNYVSKNPIDNLAKSYILTNTDIADEYGEIVFMGKNILYETKSDEFIIKSPYTVETKTHRIILYVTIVKNNENWNAVSFDIIKVIPIVYK